MTLPYWSLPSQFNLFLHLITACPNMRHSNFICINLVNLKKSKKISTFLFFKCLYMFYIRYQCLSTACPNFGTVKVQDLFQF